MTVNFFLEEKMDILDQTETNFVPLRRTVYFTIQSRYFLHCDSTTRRCSMIWRRRRVTALLVDPRACAVCDLIISGRIVDERVVKS